MTATLPTPESNLPASPSGLIETNAELLNLCTELHEAGRFAFDTEFIGESSYQPLLCLIQVATSKRVALVDPFASIDLTPLWYLLADPTVEKLVHAGDQDLAIVYQQSGMAPAAITDTQIAGGLLGLGYPLAYWRIVEQYSGIELEKAHTYSAWDRRPLSRDQFYYAIDDVKYLPWAWDRMEAQLEALDRLGWLREACDELIQSTAKPQDVRQVYTKLKGVNALEPVQASVLREVAAWREQTACEHDLPARSMMKDDVLMDIATRMPKKLENLAKIRNFNERDLQTYGQDLLAAVARGRAVPEAERPVLKPALEETSEMKRLAEQLWVAAQLICIGQQLTPSLVTTQGEMMQLARLLIQGRPMDGHPLMHGWHEKALGSQLLRFVQQQRPLRVTYQDGIRIAFE